MKLKTKINLFLLSILLIMTGLTLLVGTIGINRIVNTLNIELLELNVRQLVRETEDAHHVLAVAGVVTYPDYIQNAKNALINRFIKRSFGFKTSKVFIITRDGIVVHHSDFKPGNRFDGNFFEAMAASDTNVLKYRHGGQNWLCAYGVFPQWEWIVALSVTTEELYEKRDQYIFWMCVVTAIFLLITLFVSRYYATRITKKIETTLNCAKEVERGNLKARIHPISSHDEIGLLQRGFNAMIAQREKTEEAVRKERDRAQTYLDIAKVIFIALDSRGLVALINQKGCEILGYDEKEIRGKNWFDHFLPEEVRPSVKEVFQKLMAGNHEPVEYYENTVLTKTGSKRVIAWHNVILTNSRGEITGTLSSGEDITDRKIASKDKEKLQLQLQHAHKMEAIGTLTGGIAHDFNNIIGIILGNTELTMLNLSPESEASLNLVEVITACNRAKDVVRQLLNFSRETEPQRRPLDMASVVKESINLMKAIIPSSIDIQMKIDHDLDHIFADATQIHQLMINLFTNARHAMGNQVGKIEVRLKNQNLHQEDPSWYYHLKSGNYVKLIISDTGRGIAPEHLERVFDPYFTTKEVDKGSGMGLAVVHGIVNTHGGAVNVESTLGKGTVFSFLFPAIDENQGSTMPAIPTPLPQGSEKILFVDDENALLEMSRQILDRLGYRVETQTNPIESLERFKSDPDAYDLIITDMTMPQMTGDQLTLEIFKIRPDIPVILCTGFSENISEQEALKLGVTAYLEKPLDSRKLAETVRKVLDDSRKSAN